MELDDREFSSLLLLVSPLAGETAGWDGSLTQINRLLCRKEAGHSGYEARTPES